MSSNNGPVDFEAEFNAMATARYGRPVNGPDADVAQVMKIVEDINQFAPRTPLRPEIAELVSEAITTSAEKLAQEVRAAAQKLLDDAQQKYDEAQAFAAWIIQEGHTRAYQIAAEHAKLRAASEHITKAQGAIRPDEPMPQLPAPQEDGSP